MNDSSSIDEEEEDELKGVRGSLFEGPIELLALMQRQMLGDIVSYVFDDVKARSRAYRKDKWVLTY